MNRYIFLAAESRLVTEEWTGEMLIMRKRGEDLNTLSEEAKTTDAALKTILVRIGA